MRLSASTVSLNTDGVVSSGMLALPMTRRLMVYSAVMAMMPAMMLLMRSLVWITAVITPASAPAIAAAKVATNASLPCTSNAAATAPPSG